MLTGVEREGLRKREKAGLRCAEIPKFTISPQDGMLKKGPHGKRTGIRAGQSSIGENPPESGRGERACLFARDVSG